jgi:hypothetical protein
MQRTPRLRLGSKPWTIGAGSLIRNVRHTTVSRRLRPGGCTSNLSGMKLQDIEQKALELSERERAELVLSLMRTLAAPGSEITDEEVVRRDAEMEASSVKPMTHEEFVRRAREERGR